MKHLPIIISLLLALAACATGQSQRTTVIDPQGNRTVYESRQTGLWFTSGKLEPVESGKDQLDMPEKK